MAEWEKPKPVKSSRISRNTINLWLHKRKETGDYRAPVGYQHGYGAKITNLEDFKEFARKHGSQTQREMAEAWNGEISDRTIGKALNKIRFTRKKTYGYQERDEHKRQEFLAKISQKNLEERVYIDESGIDNRDDYGYGWNEKGQRFYALKSGKRSIRVSIISALCQKKLIAPFTFEGSCNRLVFEQWLSEKLLPMLKPGQTLILDNATFHKSEKIREVIESAECELEYLPPYSPNLNEIEHYWFPIKNRVRKSLETIEDFRERVDISVCLSS